MNNLQLIQFSDISKSFLPAENFIALSVTTSLSFSEEVDLFWLSPVNFRKPNIRTKTEYVSVGYCSYLKAYFVS